MKKASLLILLVISHFLSVAQVKTKWVKTGGSYYRDTSIIVFKLVGKDSVSNERQIELCQCAVFKTKDGLFPCDSLLRQYYITQFWKFVFSKFYIKNKLIKSDKPYWTESMGVSLNLNYQYFYNNKRVYPIELFQQPIKI